MKPTTMVRLWSLQNVFLLWLVRPKIVELSPERCVVKIPLNWITRRRDIHAMYLGTLCMGADVAAGAIDERRLAGRGGLNLTHGENLDRFLSCAAMEPDGAERHYGRSLG